MSLVKKKERKQNQISLAEILLYNESQSSDLSVHGETVMKEYLHKVQYYETDMMGITHHSNYIRWMEEARIDFLSQIGWDYAAKLSPP